MAPDRRAPQPIAVLPSSHVAAAVAVALCYLAEVRGQETTQSNAERLSKMSADEKAMLAKEERRFDDLLPSRRTSSASCTSRSTAIHKPRNWSKPSNATTAG